MKSNWIGNHDLNSARNEEAADHVQRLCPETDRFPLVYEAHTEVLPAHAVNRTKIKKCDGPSYSNHRTGKVN